MATFREVLNDLGIPCAPPGHHHSRAGWVQLDCPYCGMGSRKWHLGYNIAAGYVNCYRCGRHNVIDVLALHTGRSRAACRGLLEGVPRRAGPAVAHQGRLRVPSGVGPLLGAHRRYLAERGFDHNKLVDIWGIGGLGVVPDGLSWRIYIPINYLGEQVSWTTRSLDPAASLRYKSAPTDQESIPHKHILYGAEYARHAIVIHEGPIDVWRTGPGAVATCGQAYSIQQVKEMARYPVRAICFDSTPDAQRRARRLAASLAVWPGDTSIVTLDAKDAAEASAHEIRRLRKEFLE